jgi:hypothetical protein
VLLDYQLGLRRRVVSISTATAYTVGATQTGTVFTYGGAGSGITITLCAPEPGLWFEFAATGAIASAATIFTCGTADAFIVAGTSGGVATLTPGATTCEFTLGGLYVEILGVSTSQYLFRKWKGGATVASTNFFDGAS